MTTKIIQQSDNRLVIETDALPLARLFLIGGIVCAVIAALKFFVQHHPTSNESFQGLIGVTAMCVIAFLALYEQSVFVFDRARRLVQWQRRRAFGKKSGEARFEEIQAVIAQRPIGDDGTPSRRVALLTTKRELPLSVAYAPDTDDACVRLAEQIREFIGQPSQPDLTAGVRASISQGQVIEAIRLLREEKQLSLAEAKQFIDEMRRNLADGHGKV